VQIISSKKEEESMALESVCKTKVVTVEKNATLKTVSEFMQNQHVGSIVVTEKYKGRTIPCGIVTDRDVAIALGSSSEAQNLRVEQIMLHQPVTAKKSDGIYETMVRMQEYGVKRLPVVDSNGALFGIISADDLLALVADEINKIAKISDVQVQREKGIRTPMRKIASL
jgi:predicted transcriptional regulator